jgi:outer membrane protein
MLRDWLTLLALGAMATRASANDLLRLFGLAQARDTTLQSALYQRNAAVEVRPQALAQWLPQLTGDTAAQREYVRQQTGEEQTSAAAGVAPLGIEALPGCELTANAAIEHCNANYRSYGLTLSQTLWSFADYSRLKEADSQAAGAEATYLSAQQSLVLRVAQAYFAILAARDQLDTLRNERAAFGKLLEQAKGRLSTGLGSRSEVEQAQAFYDGTQQSVIDAQNALDDATLAMAEIVGTAPGHVAPLRDTIPLNAPDPASVEDWVASAREDNFDVRAAQLKAEAADHDIGVQRGKALPTLSLNGSVGRSTAELVIGGNQTLNVVGLSINWPLFQGGAVASAVRQSRALYHQSEAELESAQRDTERMTRAAYRNVVTGIERIGAARRAVASSAQAVEAARRDIEFDVGSEFALLNYQQSYYAAVSALNQARYDYLTNGLTLKQQAARLTQADVAGIDALLVTQGP